MHKNKTIKRLSVISIVSALFAVTGTSLFAGNDADSSKTDDVAYKRYVQNKTETIDFNDFRGEESPFDLLLAKIDTTGIAKRFGIDEIPNRQLNWSKGKLNASIEKGIIPSFIGAGMMMVGWTTEGQDGYPARIFGTLFLAFGLGKTVHEMRKPYPPYVITRINQSGLPVHTINIKNVKKEEAIELDRIFTGYFTLKLEEENSNILFEQNYKANFDLYLTEVLDSKERGNVSCIEGEDASLLLDALKIERKTEKKSASKLGSFKPISPYSSNPTLSKAIQKEYAPVFQMVAAGREPDYINSFETEYAGVNSSTNSQSPDVPYGVSVVESIPGVKCMIFREYESNRTKEACYFYPDPETPFQYRDLYVLLEEAAPEEVQTEEGTEYRKTVGPVTISEIIDDKTSQVVGYKLYPLPKTSNCCPDADKVEKNDKP